jgi:hypothetical protein
MLNSIFNDGELPGVGSVWLITLRSIVERTQRQIGYAGLIGCLILTGEGVARGQFSLVVDIEKAPFLYSASPDDNRVSRLRERLTNGLLSLEYTPDQGNLKSVLEALEIPLSSQTLPLVVAHQTI